jgi:predicted O-linked N-acetylglucosamine transferase (SPINDLY family)
VSLQSTLHDGQSDEGLSTSAQNFSRKRRVLLSRSMPAAPSLPDTTQATQDADLLAHSHWKAACEAEAQGEWLAAAEAYERALASAPHAAYAMGFGHALCKLGAHELVASLCSALRASLPDLPGAYTLQAKGMLAQAQYDQALALMQQLPEPHRDFDAWDTLARAQLASAGASSAQQSWARALQWLIGAVPERLLQSDALRSWDEAVACALVAERLALHELAAQAWQRALTLGAEPGVVNYRLAKTLDELGQRAEAAGHYRIALQHEPGSRAALLCLLAMAQAQSLDWRGTQSTLDELAGEVMLEPADVPLELNPWVVATLTSDPYLQKRASDRYASYLKKKWAAHRLESMPLKRRASVLRIGYLSSDFCQHATSSLMAEVLEAHDRSRVRVVLISNSPDDGSAMAQRIRRAGDEWVDIRGLDSLSIVHTLRALDLDILVDLKGATKDGHPEVFAMRCAPIQLSWLGFPGTMGEGLCDFIVGDPVVTPLANQAHFSERILQMPLCYQPNDSRRHLPGPWSRERAKLPAGALVLCAFHQPFKINGEVFAAWCEILRRVPQAVLWLLEYNHQVRQVLQTQAAAQGVSPERLIFAPRIEADLNLDRMACADLFLDTWPCNAHTTASEALWAGLPVVTLMGQTFASRVAASLLGALGLSELIVETSGSYIETVTGFLHDPALREQIRRRLREHGRKDAVFDGSLFASPLERLLASVVAQAGVSEGF